MTYARDSAVIATPIGVIRIAGDETAIARVSISAGDGIITKQWLLAHEAGNGECP